MALNKTKFGLAWFVRLNTTSNFCKILQYNHNIGLFINLNQNAYIDISDPL